jgi:anti-sigma-K factor RskA
MNYLLPERLDLLAREYALGTLAGPARRRFERVLRSSPAASTAVDVWRQRLSVLDLAVVPIQPPESTWRGIERRLFAPAGRTAPAPSRGALQALRGLFSGRSLGGALAGALLCAVLLRLQPGIVDLEPRIDALPQSYVGLLLDKAGKPTLVASSRRQGRQLTVKLLQPLDIPAGKVAELWALPKDGGVPFAVGVIPAKGSAQITLPDASEKLFFSVSQLAVSFESAPVKTGDAPSGAFALIGHCVKVW